ncbi:MAG: hypothetical protein K6A05_04920 [Lachnospiraceae bacterium]|nr:hypothetical protein [Lachnospiraceae bacterium]
MKIRKCDRCKNPYDPYEMEINNDCANSLGIVNMDMRDNVCSGVYYDLCPNCMGDLVAWMKLNEEE